MIIPDIDFMQALKNTGFEICLFPHDEDPCEGCGKPNKQLYFQGPADAGRYYCADCIIDEYKSNLECDREIYRG